MKKPLGAGLRAITMMPDCRWAGRFWSGNEVGAMGASRGERDDDLQNAGTTGGRRLGHAGGYSRLQTRLFGTARCGTVRVSHASAPAVARDASSVACPTKEGIVPAKSPPNTKSSAVALADPGVASQDPEMGAAGREISEDLGASGADEFPYLPGVAPPSEPPAAANGPRLAKRRATRGIACPSRVSGPRPGPRCSATHCRRR